MAKGFPYSLGRAPKESPVVRKFVYPVRDVTVAVAATGDAVGFGSAVVGDFPEGNLLFLGGVAYLQFSTASEEVEVNWSGSYGIGTTVDADGTLATTESNLATGTISAATAGLSPVTRGTSATAVVLDNTDGSLELNLNLVVANAGIDEDGEGDFVANGSV